jgi:adenylate kinase family enzyme
MVYIKQITYDVERFEFFAKKAKNARKRYNRVFKQLDSVEPYLSQKLQEVDDAARIAQFYKDVVEMLAQKMKES